MNYNFRIGTFDVHTGFLSHVTGKLVILGIGATIGFYSGAMVVIGEIQAGTPVLSQTPSDAPADFNVLYKPALTGVPLQGSAALQATDTPQAAGGSGLVQEPQETAYFPALNSNYSGPELVAR